MVKLRICLILVILAGLLSACNQSSSNGKESLLSETATPETPIMSEQTEAEDDEPYVDSEAPETPVISEQTEIENDESDVDTETPATPAVSEKPGVENDEPFVDNDVPVDTMPGGSDYENMPSLIGFWHSAPNFNEGFKEFYRFFDDGEGFEYEDADRTFYYGDWDLRDDNSLELTFFDWDGENTTKSTTQSQIEYATSGRGDVVIKIDGQKFWKLFEPVDVINGVPLYINYQFEVEDRYQDSEVIYVSNPFATGDIVVLSYDGDLYDFKIIVVDFNFDDDDLTFSYSQDGIKFELDHLPPGFIVNYENENIGLMYAEGFSFCDASGNYYAYAIWHGGRGVGSEIGKISLQNYE